jgi:hypothetical protein
MLRNAVSRQPRYDFYQVPRNLIKGYENMMGSFAIFGMLMMLVASPNAGAGFLGFGGDSWKEEVLLLDGSRIIVKRSQSYGGRGETGQGAPIKEYNLSFTLPNSNKTIKWTSEYSEDVGRANLHPLALHVLNGTPYVIAEPNLCLAYNKWGRPNPPYVIFKYDGKEWQRITLQELPIEFKGTNLVNNTKDHAEYLVDTSLVTADTIKQLNSSLTQPQYKTILREPLPKERINQMCMEMVLYKGYWVMPNDSSGRSFIDHQRK